jgi:hypothetical protein
MLMKEDMEREVDLTLELLDGWERKRAKEDLWQDVRRRMKSGAKRRSPFVVRARWQLALLVLLLGVNAVFGFAAMKGVSAVGSGETQVSRTAAGSLDDFKKEYRLTEESHELNY